MKNEHLETARALYKPTPKVEALVLKLCDLFDEPMPNGIAIDTLSFRENALKLSGLCVKKVIRCENHLGVEIHWFPRWDISTTEDPYCSAFALRYNSLEKLIKKLEEVFSLLRVLYVG